MPLNLRKEKEERAEAISSSDCAGIPAHVPRLGLFDPLERAVVAVPGRIPVAGGESLASTFEDAGATGALVADERDRAAPDLGCLPGRNWRLGRRVGVPNDALVAGWLDFGNAEVQLAETALAPGPCPLAVESGTLRWNVRTWWHHSQCRSLVGVDLGLGRGIDIDAPKGCAVAATRTEIASADRTTIEFESRRPTVCSADLEAVALDDSLLGPVS